MYRLQCVCILIYLTRSFGWKVKEILEKDLFATLNIFLLEEHGISLFLYAKAYL